MLGSPMPTDERRESASTSDDTEPRALRWKRRAVTIPTMLAATTVAILVLPVLVPMLVVADVLRGRWRLPAVRIYLFVAQYAINDSAEILIASWYWLLAGCGTRLHSPTSIRRHERLQRWSLALLERRAAQLLGIHVTIDDESIKALEPAPAIVLCRHVHIFDASLPSVLYQPRGYHVRGVIMDELLADPGFDLLYRRLGSIFIPRTNGPQARRAVAELAAGLDTSTVAVIYPEGRLFRPELLERVRAKLTKTDPERGARLAGLRHVLPVRPGGVCTLLDAAPDADIVVVAHTGLDTYPDFRTLTRHIPRSTTVRVTAWRIERHDVPSDPDARDRWLDNLWQDVDNWINTQPNA